MLTSFLAVVLLISCSRAAPTLTQALDEANAKHGLIGSTVLAFSKSQRFAYATGLSDFARNRSTAPTTRYRIASVSKHITTTGLLYLYDQKLFHWDDDINTHIGFSIRNPAFPDKPITIRQILSHTSSINDGTNYEKFLLTSYTVSEVPAISELLLPGGSYFTPDIFRAHEPGTYFYYSNLNFGIIGTLIEKLSNTRFDLFMKQTLFADLKLGCSYNVADLDNYEDLATLYVWQNAKWDPLEDNYHGEKPPSHDLVNYVIGSNGIVFGPQGGLRVSSSELEVLMKFHLNKGLFDGKQIVSQKAIEEMETLVWKYDGSNGGDLGMMHEYGMATHIVSGKPGDYVLPNHLMKGHPGDAYGLSSSFYYDHEAGWGVIYATNGAKDGHPRDPNTGFTMDERDIFNALNLYFFTQ